MTAYIVYDPEDTTFMEPSYISALDRHPHYFAASVPQHADDARRNLFTDFERDNTLAGFRGSIFLPPPSSKEQVRVFLRVKPKTIEESQLSQASRGEDSSFDEEEVGISVESDHQIALNAPKESNTYKNYMNGAGQLLHRYSFTKIFPDSTDQEALFSEMVLPRMQDFMEGQNQLIFTYGASSSGKTYTIQGTNDNPGILPRALDVIFNSIDKHQMLSLELKPNCFNRVIQMKEKDIQKLEKDKQEVFQLAMELKEHNKVSDFSIDSLNSADMTNISQECINSLFPELSHRTRDNSIIPLKHDDINYAVWISFAEIYNENIHDLLERLPEPKRKGDKPKRNPLKLAEDNNGSIFIKGLREIKVNSADEAYQVMMIGRNNLHFASTRLNHHSSRSHCIFTIKIIRVAKTAKPHLARVSMLSFCDLAGSERIKKAMNTGERQKEAGNINTSLMVLGRCMKAIRHNQTIKDTKKHQIVPYRDSKLTRLFQSFLVGLGKTSMVVNISQAPYLFDESIQVLKFAAIASKVTVKLIKTPETVKPNKKRQTRFSMMVDASRGCNVNPLFGRGSIEWDKPTARSTMGVPANDTINESCEVSALEETVIDQRYDRLIKLVDDLRDQLVKVMKEKDELEKEVRTELCDEFNEMMVEIEQRWEKKLLDEKAKSEGELTEFKTNVLNNQRMDKAATISLNETARFQNDELQIALDERVAEVKHLTEKINAVKEAHMTLAEENQKFKDDLTLAVQGLKKEQESCNTLRKELDLKTEELKKAQVLVMEMASQQSADASSVIKDLEEKLGEQKEQITTLKNEKNDLKELLDEASDDFIDRDKQLEDMRKYKSELEKELLQTKMRMKDLSGQVEELRLLTSDANARVEDREVTIYELEEKLEILSNDFLEVKQETLKFVQCKSDLISQISQLKEDKLAISEKEDQERERIARELNDELESSRVEKKKLKAQMQEQEKTLEANEKEIKLLQSEVKNLMQSNEKMVEMESERVVIRKQMKELVAELADKDKILLDQKSENEKLSNQVISLQKEGEAITLLRQELANRRTEKEEIPSKVDKLNCNDQAKDSNVKRIKSEKEEVINTYNLGLEQVSDEPSVSKCESIILGETLTRSTPVKVDKDKEKDAELKMLRQELSKKTEFIKKLEEMIPCRKRLAVSSEDEKSDSSKEIENLREELQKLRNEHEKVLITKNSLIDEYRTTNLQLQRRMEPSVTSSEIPEVTTLESDGSQMNNSGIEDTPYLRKRKQRISGTRKSKRNRGKTSGNKIDSSCQASFEDNSMLENEIGLTEGKAYPESPISKPMSTRSSRLTRALDSVLREVNSDFMLPPIEEELQKKTPKVKKLYKQTGFQEEFTPPKEDVNASTPKTIVMRQLRSRKKN